MPRYGYTDKGYSSRTNTTEKGVEECDECGSRNTKSKALKLKCYDCGLEYDR